MQPQPAPSDRATYARLILEQGKPLLFCPKQDPVEVSKSPR